jgi:hypothetical protein
MLYRQHIRQTLILITIQSITLVILGLLLPGLKIESILPAIGITIIYLLTQTLYWYLFISFFSRLPAWLFPLVSTVVTTSMLLYLSNYMLGFLMIDFSTAMLIIFILTAVTVVVESYMSWDIEQAFDRYISKRLIAKRGHPQTTNVPGILYIELDGVSEEVVLKAIQKGRMPTLKNWLDRGTHHLTTWETDFSSQTGASQAGILLGNNKNIPGYRWWERKQQRSYRSGSLRDAAEIEKERSNGNGLLAQGGASRANVFSGDAEENLFTVSKIIEREHETESGLYLYIINPFIISRILTQFIYCVFREWAQLIYQHLRRDKNRISARNFFYAFIRAGDCQILQALTTYVVIGDVLRGLPIIYATLTGYDNVAHYTGIESTESFQTLGEIDRLINRIEHAVRLAPRPYEIVLLSDHGQSDGGPFKKAYGITLGDLVNHAIDEKKKIFYAKDDNELIDKFDAFLYDALRGKPRTTQVLHNFISQITHESMEQRSSKKKSSAPISPFDAPLMVYGSGCTGLIYFTESEQRLTLEVIQSYYPNLIVELINHPGIGFLLVNSTSCGDIVMGKEGIYYLSKDTFEGINPLACYSPNVPDLLRRECSFSNCPDIIVNTRYDPKTGELTGFENQVGHHGGVGGPQSFPFLIYPQKFDDSALPIVGAESLYHLFVSWRKSLQDIKLDSTYKYTKLEIER